jgi:hypothetical protein
MLCALISSVGVCTYIGIVGVVGKDACGSFYIYAGGWGEWGYFRSTRRSSKRDYISGLHIPVNTKILFENNADHVKNRVFIAPRFDQTIEKNLTLLFLFSMLMSSQKQSFCFYLLGGVLATDCLSR